MKALLFIAILFTSQFASAGFDFEINNIAIKFLLNGEVLSVSSQRVVNEENSTNKVNFLQAVEIAIDTVLYDGEDDESAMALAKYTFEDDLTGETWNSKIADTLATKVVYDSLVESKTWIEFKSTSYAPEGGEEKSDNWIFVVKHDESIFGDHIIWIIVPKNGEAAYTYGFN
jgi:hypothetical protein